MPSRITIAWLLVVATSSLFGQECPELALHLDVVAGEDPPAEQVAVLLDAGVDQNASGFTFGVAHDSTDVRVANVAEGPALDDVGGADYFSVEIRDAEGATVGAVIDLEPEPDSSFRTLPACEENLHIATFSYMNTTSESVVIQAELVSTLGAPPVEIIVDVEGETLVPIVGDPVSLTVPPGDTEPQFIRGDVNQSGDVSVADARIIMASVFGLVEVDCEDTVDVNDDGNMNGSDAIYLLEYLLTEGSMLPPPFPALGEDQTPDSLDCARYSPTPVRESEEVRLEIEDAKLENGGETTVNVYLIIDREVDAVSFALRVPEPLELLDVRLSDAVIDLAEDAGFNWYSGTRLHDDRNVAVAGVVDSFDDTSLTSFIPPGEIHLASLDIRAAHETPAGLYVVSFVEPLIDNAAWCRIVFQTGEGGEEAVPVLVDGTIAVGTLAFFRGDTNGDGVIDIADGVCVLAYLFGGAGDPCKEWVGRCLDAADSNDDGEVDIADAVKILSHLFAATGPLPEPFGECGYDGTEDSLDPCASFPPCQ